jgi:hypothetical protein
LKDSRSVFAFTFAPISLAMAIWFASAAVEEPVQDRGFPQKAEEPSEIDALRIAQA